MSVHVNVDNFVRAETARMFADIQETTGGVNTFRHNREPAPIDAQTVIRLNRDTFYSFAVVDLSAGGRLTVPEVGDRYVSVMVVNEGHLVSDLFHGAGTFDLDARRAGSRYALLGARTLVDPGSPEDIAAVSDLQDWPRGSPKRVARTSRSRCAGREAQRQDAQAELPVGTCCLSSSSGRPTRLLRAWSPARSAAAAA